MLVSAPMVVATVVVVLDVFLLLRFVHWKNTHNNSNNSSFITFTGFFSFDFIQFFMLSQHFFFIFVFEEEKNLFNSQWMYRISTRSRLLRWAHTKRPLNMLRIRHFPQMRTILEERIWVSLSKRLANVRMENTSWMEYQKHLKRSLQLKLIYFFSTKKTVHNLFFLWCFSFNVEMSTEWPKHFFKQLIFFEYDRKKSRENL